MTQESTKANCSIIILFGCFPSIAAVFKKCGYQAIPCLILLVNNVVSYVGSPGKAFERALNNSLEAVALENEA